MRMEGTAVVESCPAKQQSAGQRHTCWPHILRCRKKMPKIEHDQEYESVTCAYR